MTLLTRFRQYRRQTMAGETWRRCRRNSRKLSPRRSAPDSGHPTATSQKRPGRQCRRQRRRRPGSDSERQKTSRLSAVTSARLCLAFRHALAPACVVPSDLRGGGGGDLWGSRVAPGGRQMPSTRRDQLPVENTTQTPSGSLRPSHCCQSQKWDSH